MGLQIIPTDLLRDYIRQVGGLNLSNCFDLLKDADLSNEDFSFHIAAAAVYSGKIEGEAIELDSRWFYCSIQFGCSILSNL